ncbi:unnamed protein product [Dracunculus medinensis]|uniref:Helicase ATP-binding domain-containing protein n=1 Tax=Dracunculus medinensis TaxID=318479 RepID=A0A3P7Q1L1_DRAME|nr:unnamed protein product [Dracunculus medinensis]
MLGFQMKLFDYIWRRKTLSNSMVDHFNHWFYYNFFFFSIISSCEKSDFLLTFFKFLDWQKECLSDQRLLNGSNMVISLPTGAGKTLIAEVMMLREVVLRQRNCLLIVPYVAIAQEKDISNFKFYWCNIGRLPPVKRRDRCSIYVATIEKANILINSLIIEDRISELGVIVIDELHMIGDGARGATIEQILSKFLFKGNSHFIKFRYLFIHIIIYYIDSLKFEKRDPDGLISLLQDIMPHNSVIIFCPTKKNCENVAKMIASVIPKTMRQQKIKEKADILNALREEQDGQISSILEMLILAGVAFHHSGLTADERRIIEDAYHEGIITIICSTSTLAAGVNLPARRVIIKKPFVGIEPIKKAQYLQMIGRAGRPGFDNLGESVTIVHPGHEADTFFEMLASPLSSCKSALCDEELLSSFILDLICLKGLVLSSQFHIIFILIPFDIYIEIDWHIFYDEVRILSFIIYKAIRLYITFMMLRIWNQESFSCVASRFRVTRGWIQSTLQSICMQASSIARFCEKVPDLWPLKLLLPDLVQRLRQCRQQELVPLLAIEGVKTGRARQLYEKGYKTVGDVAKADPNTLVHQLMHLNRKQARLIVRNAQVYFSIFNFIYKFIYKYKFKPFFIYKFSHLMKKIAHLKSRLMEVFLLINEPSINIVKLKKFLASRLKLKQKRKLEI